MKGKNKNANIFGLLKSEYARKLFLRYLPKYLLGIVCLGVIDYLQTTIPLYIGEIIDGLKTGTVNLNNIWDILILIIICTVVIIIGRIAWRLFIFGSARNIERDIRNDIFSHLENLSSDFYSKHKTGEIMAYITNDINAVRQSMGQAFLMIIDVVFLCVFTIFNMVANINVSLTILAVIPLIFIALTTFLLGPHIYERFSKKQAAFADMSDFVQENLSGMNVVKSFTQENNEIKAFEKINQNYFSKNIHLVKLRAAIQPIMRAIAGLSLAIAVGYGGYIALDGAISVGEFAAFIQYLGMLVWPMMAIGMAINIVTMGSAALARIDKILKEPCEITDENADENITNIDGNIKIDDLNFSYNNTTNDVLKGIKFEVKEGETLGIVGRTGTGKTTLVNLLMRLYNADENKIFIGEHEISTIPLKVLRSNIGYVPQDNFMFSMSVEDNVKLADIDMNHEDVINACKAACVHENIVGFADGYDTLVGERGVTLSGGQKQRISIARALIKNPKILVLDDSVSAVDTDTEEQILNYIKTNRKNKTNIIIAHRISTLMHADKIIVIDEGEIIEAGTHDELVDIGGLYNSLYQKQLLNSDMEEGV